MDQITEIFPLSIVEPEDILSLILDELNQLMALRGGEPPFCDDPTNEREVGWMLACDRAEHRSGLEG